MDETISTLERAALTGDADAVRKLAAIARRNAGEDEAAIIRLPLTPSRVERGAARAVRNFAVAFTPGGGARRERGRKLLLCPSSIDGFFDLDILMRSSGEVATVATIGGRYIWGKDNTDGKLQLRVDGKLALETSR